MLKVVLSLTNLAFCALMVKRIFQGNRFLKVGKNIAVGSGVVLDIAGELVVGNNVTISNNVSILTHDHDIKEHLMSENIIKKTRLEICDEAWFGFGAIILPSVKRIGIGAVIGAGSVVSKDVPDYTIVAGNPAKPIGTRTIQSKMV